MFFLIVITKVVVAALVALFAAAVSRGGRYPQIGFTAWLCVLVVLILPPVFGLPVFDGTNTGQPAFSKLGEKETGLHSSVPDSKRILSPVEVETEPALDDRLAAPSDGLLAGTDPRGTYLEKLSDNETSLTAAPEFDLTVQGSNNWIVVQTLLLAIWVAGSIFLLTKRLLHLHSFKQLVQMAEPGPRHLADRCNAIASQMDVNIGERFKVVAEVARTSEFPNSASGFVNPASMIPNSGESGNGNGSEICPSRAPLLTVANGHFSPFLWHPWRGNARVVLPQLLVDSLSPESLDAVIEHELHHYRRRDAWRRQAELLVIAVWWWLPIAWIARRRLHEMEELCIDAAVLRRSKLSVQRYASALLDAEEFLAQGHSPTACAAPAFAKDQHFLKTRIEMIAKYPQTKFSLSLSRLVAAATILLVLPFGLLTAGTIQEQTPKSNASKKPPQSDQLVQESNNKPKSSSAATQEADESTAKSASVAADLLKQIHAHLSGGKIEKAKALMTKTAWDEFCVRLVVDSVSYSQSNLGVFQQSLLDGRDRITEAIKKHGLDQIELTGEKGTAGTGKEKTDKDKSSEDNPQAILKALDASEKRNEIIAELWQLKKSALTSTSIFGGTVEKETREDDTLVAVVMVSKPGQENPELMGDMKYLTLNPPAVIELKKAADTWIYAGIDNVATEKIREPWLDQAYKKLRGIEDPADNILRQGNFISVLEDGFYVDEEYEVPATLDRKKIIFFYFSSSTCGPCHRVTPLLLDFLERNEDNVQLVQVNGDKDTERMLDYWDRSEFDCPLIAFNSKLRKALINDSGIDWGLPKMVAYMPDGTLLTNKARQLICEVADPKVFHPEKNEIWSQLVEDAQEHLKDNFADQIESIRDEIGDNLYLDFHSEVYWLGTDSPDYASARDKFAASFKALDTDEKLDVMDAVMHIYNRSITPERSLARSFWQIPRLFFDLGAQDDPETAKKIREYAPDNINNSKEDWPLAAYILGSLSSSPDADKEVAMAWQQSANDKVKHYFKDLFKEALK